MNIQTISIVIPTNGCINNCKFCVSKMHKRKFKKYYEHFQIKKRIQFASNNGVNTCIITGTGEALQNKEFLENLIIIFEDMNYPFPNVELQTSGVLLSDNDNIKILKKLGINPILLEKVNVQEIPNAQELKKWVEKNNLLYVPTQNLKK